MFRTIYFANSNRRHPSIEAFSPDSGPGSLVSVVRANLTRPRAVTFDGLERKLYWTDTRRGLFSISRADSDGGAREVVCELRRHDGFSLAVDQVSSDWSVRKILSSDWSGLDLLERLGQPLRLEDQEARGMRPGARQVLPIFQTSRDCHNTRL